MTTLTTDNAVGWSAASFWENHRRLEDGLPNLGSVEINEGQDDE